MGEYGITFRCCFQKDNGVGKRILNIYVFAQGSEQIYGHIAFRDFMNSHQEWAIQYCSLNR